MSARVFNPHIMSEMRRVMRGGGHLDLSESETRSPRDNNSLERVKKCLFDPVDHNECKLFAQQEMESHLENLSKKWNFDFKKGEPGPSGDGCVYEWRGLQSDEAVPEAYALARLPFLKQHTDIDPPIRSGTECSQSCSSSSSFTSPTRTVQSRKKQTVLTEFMRQQKPTRRISTMSSVKEEEPATKKARTCSS